jgi:hypothetical protein
MHRADVVIVLLLASITFAVFLPTCSNGFVNHADDMMRWRFPCVLLVESCEAQGDGAEACHSQGALAARLFG